MNVSDSLCVLNRNVVAEKYVSISMTSTVNMNSERDVLTVNRDQSQSGVWLRAGGITGVAERGDKSKRPFKLGDCAIRRQFKGSLCHDHRASGVGREGAGLPLQ